MQIFHICLPHLPFCIYLEISIAAMLMLTIVGSDCTLPNLMIMLNVIVLIIAHMTLLIEDYIQYHDI
jgi:hypothetical protein